MVRWASRLGLRLDNRYVRRFSLSSAQSCLRIQLFDFLKVRGE